MPFTSNDAHPPRRNARSFDLDDSAAKAAAWVWHLHTSKPGVTTEGRFISSQSRRRSSGSYDRRASRFQQEASTSTSTLARGNKTEPPMWDCGSNLYDTFELVAFGNRLDRSLMEVIPITPRGGHLQEHHMKSPLHKPGGVLRTLSLPRSFAEPKSKNGTVISSPNPEVMKPPEDSYNNHTRASPTSSAPEASTKWSGLGKFMNVIKRVVWFSHKQVSFGGCKRSTNVIESRQRPLDPSSRTRDSECTRENQFLGNEKVRATRNNRASVSMDDELSIQYTKTRSNSESMSNHKLPIIPSRDNKSNYESNLGDKSSMQKKSRAYSSETFVGKKIRSNSETMSDDGISEHKKIWPRMSDGLSEHKKIWPRMRKSAKDELVLLENRIKGSSVEDVCVKERIKGTNLESAYVKERIKGADELLDLHKHLHHHHHHHHHHHYLHHNLGSESARLSPETMSHICAEQSWLI